MKQTALVLIGLLVHKVFPLPNAQSPGNGAIECAALPSPWPSYQEFPRQTTLPDPFLPLKYMTIDNAGSDQNGFTSAVEAGRGKNRVLTPEAWRQCQRPQLIQMLQHYQYGLYPDHSKETVAASRSGSTVSISVTAGGKTGKFTASLRLPSGKGPFPAVINIGGMQNAPYLSAGISVVGFNYQNVAADSSSKTGAFWDIYKGQDIGTFSGQLGGGIMSVVILTR